MKKDLSEHTYDHTEIHLYGIEPLTEKGRYFKNNILLWHPLWFYIAHHCKDIITEEQIRHAREWDFQDVAKSFAIFEIADCGLFAGQFCSSEEA